MSLSIPFYDIARHETLTNNFNIFTTDTLTITPSQRYPFHLICQSLIIPPSTTACAGAATITKGHGGNKLDVWNDGSSYV